VRVFALEVQRLKPAESVLFHSVSKPEVLGRPDGTKKYVWHFSSSHLLPLPSQIFVLVRRHVCVYISSCPVVGESLT